MCHPNYLMQALDTVLAWNLSDESFALAFKAQATLMAGSDPEQINSFRLL